MAKHKSSDGYIKKDQFIEIALECNCDIYKVVDYVLENKIAKEYTVTTARRRIQAYREKGYLPLESGNKVPEGMLAKKVSTYYDKKGKVRGQWVSAERDNTKMLQAFEYAISKVTNEIIPLDPIEPPTEIFSDTMSVYTIGDAHVGMLAWAPESGEDNDLETATFRHIKAMHMLVNQSNPTEEAFIIDVGDFYHSDNTDNRTANGGNPLDVDGRYAKVLDIGFRLATTLVNLALQKHKTVRWRSAIGNHNNHSALMMNMFMKAFYRDNPRVIVHDEPGMFMYHQFGQNLIGITHGHTVKAEKLGEIMSVDCQDIWSSTKFRYFYTGHIHHQSVKEFPSCVVETFRTLASKDAWHASMGYRSGQDMKCITLHKDYGEISRNTVNISMLQQQ